MRASALGLLLLAAAASAQDLGRPVTFSHRPDFRFSALAGGLGARPVLFDSGPSDPPGPGNVILFDGVSPDPHVTFQAGRYLGGGWMATDVEMHRRPDGRFWARGTLPSGTGPILLRALDDGIGADHTVEVYGVELLTDVGELPERAAAPLVPARPPQPGAVRPPVHGRTEWNARPATEPYTPHESVWRITLHHSDGRNTDNLADSLAEARFIQEYHQQGRHWIDIAYHFLVDEAGNVIEGRPEGVQGAHTLGNNAGNIGICLLGKYHDAGDHTPTPAQLAAVASLARYLTLRYGIDPLAMLKGHRDYKSTDCPGDHAYALLPDLRRRADGSPTLGPSAQPPAAWDGVALEGLSAGRR